MDQTVLVKSGHIIVKALDDAGIPPRAAMWVYHRETDTWKLWIVQDPSLNEKREFYRRISEIIKNNSAEIGEIDASDTQMVSATHPAIQGLKHIVKMSGLGSVHFSNNMFNGFYLPDGIVLRMNV